MERLRTEKITDVVNRWNLGTKYYKEGYEDMGFSIRHHALEDAMSLSPEERMVAVDLMFPDQENGN